MGEQDKMKKGKRNVERDKLNWVVEGVSYGIKGVINKSKQRNGEGSKGVGWEDEYITGLGEKYKGKADSSADR